MLNLKAELLEKQKEYDLQKNKTAASFISSNERKGDCFNLIHDMWDLRESFFYTLFRMTSENFDRLLAKIQPRIRKQIPARKHLPWEKKNTGVEDRNRRDVMLDEEQSDKLSKVHAILEAKSKMYDKMTSGNVIPDQESSQLFLVDFEQKAIDAWRSKREAGEKVKPEVNVHVTEEVKRTITDAAEQWVEYVDALGRTRTCLKQDLPKLERMDRKLGSGSSTADNRPERTLMSDDMRREEKRKEWEEEEAQRVALDEGPIHYENVRFGEVRELGVGYYAFSSDKEKREEQMKRLQKLREDTEKQKVLGKEKKEKEKTALKARLDKVRQRKIKMLQKQGKEIPESLLQPIKLPDEEEEENNEEEEQQTTKAEPLEEKPPSPELPYKLREWDEGKGNLWTPAQAPKAPRSWSNPRDERPEEFAPPSFYFNDGKKKPKRGTEPATSAMPPKRAKNPRSDENVEHATFPTRDGPNTVARGHPSGASFTENANVSVVQTISDEDNARIERILEKFSAKSASAAVSGETDASFPCAAASGKPDVASGKPDAASGKPDVASGKPNAASGKPDVASGKPDVASGKPDVASGKPNVASDANEKSETEEILRPFVPSAKPITINVKSMPVRTLKTKSAFNE